MLVYIVVFDRVFPFSPFFHPVDVNLSAVVNGTRLGYHAMMSHPLPPGGGVILNISSLGGLVGQPYSPVYCATKHGVIGLVRSLGYLKKHGIRVVGLAPGFTDTNLVASGREESHAFRTMIEQATQVSGPLMSVDDIVEGAFLLLNDPQAAGVVLSVSREMGFARHATPILYSMRGGTGAPNDEANVAIRAATIPHKTIRPLQAKL